MGRISTAIRLFRFFRSDPLRFPGTNSSLRSSTGFEDELDESCGGDEEDESLPELVDNPGTTRGTKFSVLQKNLVWLGAFLDRWPI